MEKTETLTYDQRREIARSFVRTRATLDDIDELEDMIDIRKKSLVDFTCGDGNLE